MDLKMRHLDGLAATRQLLAAFPEARILIVTASERATLREAARQAGATHYVMKDNLQDLHRILAQQTDATLS